MNEDLNVSAPNTNSNTPWAIGYKAWNGTPFQVTATSQSTSSDLHIIPLESVIDKNDSKFIIQDGSLILPYTGTIFVSVNITFHTFSPSSAVVAGRICKNNNWFSDVYSVINTMTSTSIPHIIRVNKNDKLWMEGYMRSGTSCYCSQIRMHTIYISLG